MNLFGQPRQPDRCEAIDGTIIDGHFYANSAAFGSRPVWVCVNCGLPR